MLFEDPKHPYNPAARVNPRRRQHNLISPDDKKQIDKGVKLVKAAKRAETLHAMGHQAAGWFVSPRVSGALVGRAKEKSIDREDRKLDRKERRRRMKKQKQLGEARASKTNWWQKANQGVKTGLNKAKEYGVENPIAGTALSLGAGIGIQTAATLGTHYLTHKAQMRNPVYAAQTRELALDRKLRRGSFTPMKKRVAQAQGQTQGQQGKSVSPQPDMNPQPQTHGQGSGHDPTQALKDPILPSQAGTAGNKKGKGKNKGAGKEDNNMDVTQAPDEARPWEKQSNKAIAKGHQPSNAHIAVMRGMDMNTVNSAGLAHSDKFKVGSNTKTNTRKESWDVASQVVERVDRLDEWAAQAGKVALTVAKSPIARKMATAAATSAAGTFAANKVQQKMDKKSPSVADDVIDIAANIYEVHPMLVKLGVQTAMGVAGGIGGAIGTRIGHAQLPKKKKPAPRPVGEGVGAGQLSNYEFNKHKTDTIQDVNKFDRNKRIERVSSSVRRSPKNFNAPRKRATDDPRIQRTEGLAARIADLLEMGVSQDVVKVGSAIDRGVTKTVGGAVRGAGRGASAYAHWLGQGQIPKKLAYTAAALYGAKKVKDAVVNNPRVLRKQAEYHRNRYNTAASRLSVAQEKAALKRRKRDAQS